MSRYHCPTIHWASPAYKYFRSKSSEWWKAVCFCLLSISIEYSGETQPRIWWICSIINLTWCWMWWHFQGAINHHAFSVAAFKEIKSRLTLVRSRTVATYLYDKTIQVPLMWKNKFMYECRRQTKAWDHSTGCNNGKKSTHPIASIMSPWTYT